MNLFLIALSILIFDQIAKWFVSHAFALGDSIPVWNQIFHLTLVHNEGIAFGLFGALGNVLVILITISVLILFYYSIRLKGQSLYFQIAYGFVLGGAVGNLIDRLRLGYVVDFLDFRIWPVFNIADTFISIGIGLLILKSFSKSDAS